MAKGLVLGRSPEQGRPSSHTTLDASTWAFVSGARFENPTARLFNDFDGRTIGAAQYLLAALLRLILQPAALLWVGCQ